MQINMSRHADMAALISSCLIRAVITGLGIAVVVVLMVMLSSVVRAEVRTADYRISQPNEARSGSLFLRGDGTGGQSGFTVAPVLNTEVKMVVTGLINRALVRQKFKNETDVWQEGVYVFPLPDDAAVDHLRMWIGERVIEGEIHEKAQAKKIYHAAKKQGKKASLIEQERPNIFTTSVANIGPGEEVIIEIEYQQSVRYDTGLFSLRFPLVVGPRYIPGAPLPQVGDEPVKGFTGTGWAQDTDQVADASRITPPVEPDTEKPINPVRLTIDLLPGFELEQVASSTHAIDQQPLPEGGTRIALAAGTVSADRDFELTWRSIASKAPQAALFRHQDDTGEYALLMMMPPTDAAKSSQIARDVVFVVDTSGSMSGTSIEQARKALRLAVGRLTPQDRFNIIQFNSHTSTLFDRLRPADSVNCNDATNYIDRLHADGGTEMFPALQRAFDMIDAEHQLAQIIFLTDGSIGNEAQLFELINRRIGDTRLFTVGIGSAPNGFFMTRAARFGRGTYQYINNVNQVQERMSQLWLKLERAVLTDIKFSTSLPGVEHYPEQVPDLYAGEPLMIALKADQLPKSVEIMGGRNHSEWRKKLILRGGIEAKGIPVLWARRKIKSLLEERFLGKDEATVRKEVLEVALAHHLVTKYTSLVAVDKTPSRPVDERLRKSALKTALPHGWKYKKVFGGYPQTATWSPLLIAGGLGGLLLSLLGWLPWVRYRDLPPFAGKANASQKMHAKPRFAPAFLLRQMNNVWTAFFRNDRGRK